MKPEELNTHLHDLVETLLDDNHALSFSMKGFSMYPALRPGDIGTVEKCTSAQIKVGDIVVFKLNKILVAHRLIDIVIQDDGNLFIAKGDKNCHKDQAFTSDDLLGKLSSFRRKNNEMKIDSLSMRLLAFLSLHFSMLTVPFWHIILWIKGHVANYTSNFHSVRHNLSIVTKHSGKELVINIIISALKGILPFVIIVCIKSLIDNLTQTSTVANNQQFIFVSVLILTAFVFLLNGVLTELKGFFSEKLSQSIVRRIYEKLHNKHASLDLSHYENPAEQDKIHRAVQEASFRPIKIVNELQMGIKSVAAVLFMVGMFISIRWYLVLLLLIAIIPTVLVRLKSTRKFYKLKDAQSTKEREMYYYNRVLTGFPFAKEMKLFGFFHYFYQRFSNVQDNLFDEKISLRKSELKYAILAQVFAIILIFISLAYVSLLKIRGEITIGTVVLFFFAFQRGYSVLNDFFRSITQMLEDSTYLNDFIAFLNMPTRSNVLRDPHTVFSVEKEIKFEHVSFSYESSKREALKDINIKIPAGKTVAFVGANGSGKTTLIKLLCGFYQPDAGRILFDGIDAKQIGQSTICENISAVFQDFALYNLSALENVQLGNIQIKFDLEKAKNAAQAAGIDHLIEHLPNGYQTLLGNLFKGGEELSIGQWQKIAIARAFYRDSPLLLMDEPSSALDADSELQIIRSLKKLSRNKTAVIISHRLSTVQWADLIYLLDKGEVVESGNHQELMALHGKYFSLFKTLNERA